MGSYVQVIQGASLTISNSTNSYACLGGGVQTSISTQSRACGIASSAGTLRNFYIRFNSAPGSSKSWTITVYKNGSPTAITVTISGADTSGHCTSDTEVEVSAGDTLSLCFSPTNSPSTDNAFWSIDFISDSGETLLLSASNSSKNNLYCFPIGIFTETSNEYRYVLLIPCAGTIKNFYVISENAAGSGKYSTFTVRKNASDQALAVTLSGSSDVSGSDLVHEVSVSPGDQISIQRTGDSTANMYANFGLTFIPSTLGNFILGYSSTIYSFNGSGTQYFPLSFPGQYSSIEGYRQCPSSSFTIKNIYVLINSSSGSNLTYKLRINGADSGLSVTIPSGDTTATASQDISIHGGDLINSSGPSSYKYTKVSYTGYKLNITTKDETITSDTKIITARENKTINSDSVIKATTQEPINSNAHIKVIAAQESILSNCKIITASIDEQITSDTIIKQIIPKTIISDAKILNSIKETITSDSKIINVRQQDILSDTIISERKQEAIISNTAIKREETKDILSDSKVVNRNTEDIVSDSMVRHTEDTELLSDAKIVSRIQEDISSNSFIKAVKYFYGQIKARAQATKKFFGQLHLGQPTPLDPTGVVFSDLYVGDAIEITWVDSGNYGYNVYKDVGGSWIKLNSSILVGATSYIAGALTTGVSYTFKVVGVNGANEESTGVVGSKTPTFNVAHFTSAAYVINIAGTPLTNAILDTVELVYGPQYSTARFHLNILPSTVGLPNADKQEVTIYIRGRLVFTGRLTRRENAWSSNALQVNYTAIDKSWDYTWTTPICAGFKGLGFGWSSDGLINSLLRAMGLPTGLPIKNSLQNSSFYDQTYREIMSSFASECGSWVTHTDEYGVVRYYEYGHPVFNRTYTLGVNILEYKDTTDVTDQVDKVVVRSPAGRSFEEKYVSQNIEGLLVSSAEMTDVAEPNRSGSPITSSYNRSRPQPWLAGPTGWTRAGITGRAQYIQTSYDSKPFIAFSLSGYTDISDLRIEAFVNDRPTIIEPELNSAGQQLEVSPEAVGLTKWATNTTESRPCANKIMRYAAAWKPVNAQTVMVGGTMYIRIDEIPVVFEDRIIQTSRTTSIISPADASISSIDSNVMYMEEPWQRIAPIRITFTHSGTYATGAYGTGTIQRSQLLSTYDELTDRAHEIYSRLQHNTVQGTMSILGDETISLRTHVNGLEVMRITHDFSNGFRTHLDLTTPQNLYVLEVEKNYRDQVISRDINKATESIFNSTSTNGSGVSGGSVQDKKRDIRTSGASWGD